MLLSISCGLFCLRLPLEFLKDFGILKCHIICTYFLSMFLWLPSTSCGHKQITILLGFLNYKFPVCGPCLAVFFLSIYRSSLYILDIDHYGFFHLPIVCYLCPQSLSGGCKFRYNQVHLFFPLQFIFLDFNSEVLICNSLIPL